MADLMSITRRVCGTAKAIEEKEKETETEKGRQLLLPVANLASEHSLVGAHLHATCL